MPKDKLIVEHVLETVALHNHNTEGLSVIGEEDMSDAYYSAGSDDFDHFVGD